MAVKYHMSDKLRCITLFDITATGVRGSYKSRRLPTQIDRGEEIPDQLAWARLRNQQRNWDTVNQVISLRVLPENISTPVMQVYAGRRTWSFSFDVPDSSAVSEGSSPLDLLRKDSEGVPMITGLDEDSVINNTLCCVGPDTNIWFELVTDK